MNKLDLVKEVLGALCLAVLFYIFTVLMFCF